MYSTDKKEKEKKEEHYIKNELSKSKKTGKVCKKPTVNNPFMNRNLLEISKSIDFAELCITSSAEVSFLKNSETKVKTTKAEGLKCQVCWKITKEACSRKTCPKI